MNRVRRLQEYRTRRFRERLVGECHDQLRILDLIEGGQVREAATFLRDHLNRAWVAKARFIQNAATPTKRGRRGAGRIGRSEEDGAWKGAAPLGSSDAA